jgi:NNP family nitrate/nitrite transporter-like MFS transporter
MLAAAIVFVLWAKDSPEQPAPRPLREYLGVLRQADALWFCLFYAITFGGFVGLSGFLGLYFRDQYGVDKVVAGDLTALCVFAGSFMRPLGGWLADRVGGIRTLGVVYTVVAALLAAIASSPAIALATALFVLALALLGAGNGAVFQLVPMRFRREIGAVTGLVGAAGGIGGFVLPSLLGVVRDLTGTYAVGFLLIAGACVAGTSLLAAVSGTWRVTWAARDRATPARSMAA